MSVWTTASEKDFHNFRKLGVYPFAQEALPVS